MTKREHLSAGRLKSSVMDSYVLRAFKMDILLKNILRKVIFARLDNDSQIWTKSGNPETSSGKPAAAGQDLHFRNGPWGALDPTCCSEHEERG